MMVKKVLIVERQRRIPRQFSWIDHRLVRDNHLCDLSHCSQGLYLFLVTVSDADGLSYYSDASIGRYLSMTQPVLEEARRELCDADLLAFQKPLYQVLSLEKPLWAASHQQASRVIESPHERAKQELAALGAIMRQAMGGAA